MDEEAAPPPTVTIKAKIEVVKEIREALTPTQVKIFEETCFGHWLGVGLKKNSQLLIHTLLTCMVDGKANELSFLVLGKRIRFRRQEFCLVTGLRFGSNMYMKKWVKNLTDNPFRNRIFPHIKANVSVKLSDIIDIFDKMRKRTLVLEDNDAVRICLLVLLQQGFLGHQLSHNVSDDMLKLVEHLSNCWNIFPWGSYIWEYTYSQLKDALHRRKLLHDAKREKGEKIQYTMTGFVWAFMIWILEAIPATHRYVHKQPTEKIPRALAWESTQPFTWSRCCTLFVGDQLTPPLETLTPTKAESETDWWKASLEYFEEKCRERSKPCALNGKPGKKWSITGWNWSNPVGTGKPCRERSNPGQGWSNLVGMVRPGSGMVKPESGKVKPGWEKVKPRQVEVFTSSSGVWNVIPSSNLPCESIRIMSATHVVIDRKLFTFDIPDCESIIEIRGYRKSSEPIIVTQRFGNFAALEVYSPSSKHIHNLGIYGKCDSFFMGSYMETLLLLDTAYCFIYYDYILRSDLLPHEGGAKLVIRNVHQLPTCEQLKKLCFATARSAGMETTVGKLPKAVGLILSP
ncbi:phospholipase-like protein [Tanacetum coccineum]